MSSLSSPLRRRLRDEALFGRLPLLADERPHTVGSALEAGARVALAAWGLLVGGYTANSLGAVAGVLILFAGNIVGVTLAAACALASNRYGVDTIDSLKPCFGQRGAKAVLLLFVASQIIWGGLMQALFGHSIQNIFISMGMHPGPGVVRLMVSMGILTAYALVARGTRGINWARGLAVPSLVVVTLIVFYGVLRDVALADLPRIPPLTPPPDTRLGYVMAFECALGTGFSWWCTMGRLTRQADSQRTSLYPQVLSLGIGTAFVCSAGHLAALLFRNYDPTQWLVFLGGRAFGALTLAVVAGTSIATCATIARTMATSMRHFARLRHAPWSVVTALVMSPTLAFVLWPTHLYERGGALIGLHATVLAPLAAVYLVDYFVLRRQRINLSQLFEDDRRGNYWFWMGFNPAALSCALAGHALGLWLFDPLSQTPHASVRLIGATGPAMLLSGLAYLAVAKLLLVTSGLGGYDDAGQPEPLSRPNI